MKRLIKTMRKALLINVIGNICSGKSTLMDKLLDLYPEASFLKIDEYRKEYNAVSPMSDGNAWLNLIKDATSKRFVFVESTGSSYYYKTLQETFPGSIMTILVDAKYQTSLARYQARENNLQISSKYSIEISMAHIQSALYNLWDKGQFDIVINNEHSIQVIDLECIISRIYKIREQSRINLTKPFQPDA